MWITREMREHLVTFPIFFNGIDLSEYIIPGMDDGRELLDRSIEILQVPGQYGGYVQNIEYPPRKINQEILIAAESKEELQKVMEHLNKLLNTKEEVPIKFGDELDRTYYGFYAGVTPSYKKEGFYKATISFLCPRPFKLSEPDTYSIKDGMAVLYNKGAEETPPYVKVLVKEPITHLDIFNDQDYKRIGRQLDESDMAVDPETIILNNPMASKVGWTETDAFVDGGLKGGSIEANGYSFRAVSFGTGEDWHGPAEKTSLSEPLIDFLMEVKIIFKNPSIKARGRLEWYLLDDQGQFVGKLAMKRIGAGAYGNRVEIRLGDASGEFILSSAGQKGIEWRDFEGVLRIGRIGNKWVGYVARVDNVTGRHTARASVTYIDADYKFTRNFSQLQLHFGQHGTTEATNMYAMHAKVVRINPEPEGVPYIARQDDVIEMDFDTGLILINGEPVEVEEDFGGDFFDVPTGQSNLLFEPADKLDFTQSHVVLRERNF